MRVTFWTSDKDREHATAEAMRRAVEAAGDVFEERDTSDYEGPMQQTNVACSIGVKGASRRIMLDCGRVGQKFLLFDKAHLYPRGGRRDWETWRVSLDDLFPTAYMMEMADNADRFDQLGWTVQPPREVSWRHVRAVVVGSSPKHCAWHGIEDAHEWARRMCRILRRRLKVDHLIYRPKPSDESARPIDFADEHAGPDVPFSSILDRVDLVVALGSNATVEALVAGCRVAVTSMNVASPVLVSTDFADIRRIEPPDPVLLRRWLNAVAWCQWRADELPQMWDEMRRRVMRPL